MNILSIPLDQIDAGGRLRPIDLDYAQLIASSMAERGQMTPIEVRPAAGARPLPYVLVAGAHRLAGAALAGLTAIDAVVFEGSELEAALREIDENLIRHELKELDRATFLARRKAVYEEMHPETKRGGKREKGANRQFGALTFSVAAQEKLGLSERTIERAVARFNRLTPDVREAIGGLWIADHGAQLDALARLSPSLQQRVAETLVQFPGMSSVSEALAHVEGRDVQAPDPADVRLDAFHRLWRRMTAGERRQVRDFVVKQKGNV